jgi:hypothetical protein
MDSEGRAENCIFARLQGDGLAALWQAGWEGIMIGPGNILRAPIVIGVLGAEAIERDLYFVFGQLVALQVK